MLEFAAKEKTKENRTGIPTQLKERMEQHAGMSFDDVRVHYNSDMPARLGALAYTQGNQVEISPGQERHLSHEPGHVTQQKCELVRPTGWLVGVNINENSSLEQMVEQDSFSLQFGNARQSDVIQRFKVQDTIWDTDWARYQKVSSIQGLSPEAYERIIQILIEKGDLPDGKLTTKLTGDIDLIKRTFRNSTASSSGSGSQLIPSAPQEHPSPIFTVLEESGGQPSIKIMEDIWDTEWSPDVKISHIQGYSPKTFDAITTNFIMEIGKVKKDTLLSSEQKQEQNRKLREELIYIVDQYNRLLPSGEMESEPHVNLPQAKTVAGAPSRLVIGQTSSESETARGINLNVYRDVCKQLGIMAHAPDTALSGVSHGAAYIEDPIEILRNGYISTRIAYPGDASKAIIAGRRVRNLSSNDIPDNQVGAKSDEGAQGVRIAKDVCRSLLQSDDLRHAYRLCPIEGGNMLTGSDFIIVGKDSLYATMELFDVNDDEARELIAKDFGILNERVFPVEQPGAYHLDLCMLLVDDKTVLLKAKDERHPSIKKTEEDLKSYGFEVIFEDGCAIGDNFNFINGEFLKIGGKVIFLTNAPSGAMNDKLEQAKRNFSDLLRTYGVEDVYFIRGSLDDDGTAGFGCRAKGVPDELIRKQPPP